MGLCSIEHVLSTNFVNWTQTQTPRFFKALTAEDRICKPLKQVFLELTTNWGRALFWMPCELLIDSRRGIGDPFGFAPAPIRPILPIICRCPTALPVETKRKERPQSARTSGSQREWPGPSKNWPLRNYSGSGKLSMRPPNNPLPKSVSTPQKPQWGLTKIQ